MRINCISYNETCQSENCVKKTAPVPRGDQFRITNAGNSWTLAPLTWARERTTSSG